MASINVDIETPAKEYIPINTNLGDYVSNGVSAIILVAGIATFLYLIWGGIEWIISGGNKEKVQGAKDKLTNAIIGLGIVAAAWAIFRLVDHFFGIGIAG